MGEYSRATAHSPGDLAAQHLARIVDSSDDAIVSKDLDGTILSWNGAAERMFGYTAAEAIGRSIRMIIPADRQSEEDYVLGRIRAGKSVQHYETIRQAKDGTLIPISLTVSPIYNDQGAVVGASKIARDISERKAADLAVRRLASVVDSSDDAIIAKDLNSRITSWNRAAERMFGYTASEAIGQSVRMIIPADLQKEEDVVLASIRAGQTVDHFETRRRHKDGHELLLSVTVSPIVDDAGVVIGASKIARDITEQSRLRAAAQEQALENARLYREACQADRLKDEFLAVLSHELRTPLNAIVGYARLLRGGVLGGEKAQRGLETIERNANALTHIVEDVLDVSRIVAGKIRLDVQPVELPLVVHNAVATMQPAADAKRIQLQTIIDPRVGPVSGDPDRLQQVVWNLLSNAVKFTPAKGRVEVRVECVASHNEITVSDTGVGIHADFLPHVFERFRQADASTTRKAGGLGLGLSIVRNIIEVHGGSVDVASEGEGRGATFRVRLPLRVVQAASARETREHPRTEKIAPWSALGDLTGIRALAIDDEEDALGLLRTVLEAAGAEVMTAPSAAAALDQLEEMKPHVLVVDLGMPGMDGFEFITRLRASPNVEIRDIPAAALTAFARSEDRTKALRSGFEMHLAKPVDPGELVESIATLVRRSAKARQ